MNDLLELNIYSGDFQLPSIDLDSLFVTAYCSLAEIKIDIKQRNDPYFSKLPSLETVGTKLIYTAENIIEHFESLNYNSELVRLSEKYKFDIRSYITLFKSKLEPCLQYIFWYDEENFNENIGRWYSQKSPFPINFFVARSLRKQYIEKLEKCFSIKVLESDDRKKLIEKKVFTDALLCLNLISNKLSNKKFLLEDKPTVIDAYLFGYLAFFYKLPVKKEIIKNHIRATPILYEYTERILMKIYSNYPMLNTTISASKMDNQFKISWWDLFFSGCVASFLMVYYAVSNGILSIEALDNDDENDDDDDENNDNTSNKTEQEDGTNTDDK